MKWYSIALVALLSLSAQNSFAADGHPAYRRNHGQRRTRQRYGTGDRRLTWKDREILGLVGIPHVRTHEIDNAQIYKKLIKTWKK